MPGNLDERDLYRIALDTRNFEITLFWQRSNYFLVLNTALAVGFLNARDARYSLLLVALGIIVSLLWFGVGLGSKFWQSRWEHRLRLIEKRIAPNADLFAADWPVIYSDVRESLRNSDHTGLRKLHDGLVLWKPSVSYMMSLLSVVFLMAWLVVLTLQLLRCVAS